MAKCENKPDVDEIAAGETIDLPTRFGGLSRGKCWGKCFPGKTRPTGDWHWVDKSGGVLFLTEPGYYLVGSSDGFSRTARGEFCLRAAAAAPDEVDAAIARVNGEGAIVAPEQFDTCM